MTSSRIVFSPRSTTTSSDLERGVLRSVALSSADVWVASHGLDLRPLVDRLAACRVLGGRVRVVLEGRNLVEDDVAGDHWHAGGDAEPLRQAICALWRSNVPVRLERSSALVHANVVLGAARRTVFVTSANLTAKGLRTHANGGIELADALVYDALAPELERLWRGSPRGGGPTGTTATSRDGSVAVHVGARHGLGVAIGELVASARRRVRFAMFTFSSRSAVKDELARLVGRGVDVQGVVDGDQAGLSFDVVPLLRESGVDARYVPGILTGGRGRMHHKLFVVDGETLAMGTYNLGDNARSSYEILVILRGPAARVACAAAEDELDRLRADARTSMPLRPGVGRGEHAG